MLIGIIICSVLGYLLMAGMCYALMREIDNNHGEACWLAVIWPITLVIGMIVAPVRIGAKIGRWINRKLLDRRAKKIMRENTSKEFCPECRKLIEKGPHR